MGLDWAVASHQPVTEVPASKLVTNKIFQGIILQIHTNIFYLIEIYLEKSDNEMRNKQLRKIKQII